MKYKTLIRIKSFYLLTLLATVWLAGCTQEEFDATSPIAETGVRFTLTVPDAGVYHPYLRAQWSEPGWPIRKMK